MDRGGGDLLATIYPLAFWMTRLPRNLSGSCKNDFFSVPTIVETTLFPLYVSPNCLFRQAIYQY